MATHSSVLAWRIPGQGSLVGCCLWGRTESDMTERLSSSSIVAYRMPWTEEPGGLESMGSQKVRHD